MEQYAIADPTDAERLEHGISGLPFLLGAIEIGLVPSPRKAAFARRLIFALLFGGVRLHAAFLAGIPSFCQRQFSSFASKARLADALSTIPAFGILRRFVL
jgi:hypothetical protein